MFWLRTVKARRLISGLRLQTLDEAPVKMKTEIPIESRGPSKARSEKYEYNRMQKCTGGKCRLQISKVVRLFNSDSSRATSKAKTGSESLSAADRRLESCDAPLRRSSRVTMSSENFARTPKKRAENSPKEHCFWGLRLLRRSYCRAEASHIPRGLRKKILES
jgi:hypothetical protein